MRVNQHLLLADRRKYHIFIALLFLSIYNEGGRITEDKQLGPRVIQWHPAFAASMKIEFEDELDKLTFEEEHLLGRKPMQIDELIIKLRSDTVIEKNIGRIFRKYNIVEYKSPEDYLCINDFYKVYGYTCFYQSETEHVCEIDPQESTI